MARSTSMTRDEILANPGEAKAILDTVSKASKDPMPVADLPPDDLVTLPGGLVHKGDVIKHVVVRELNGEHEESMAKALKSTNIYHFLNTMIACGVARVGQLSEAESQAVLPDLLIGDRDEILLGIRRATYGDTVEVFNWSCPNCAGLVDAIEFNLAEDIDRGTLNDPATDTSFEIPLRRGAKARVRLATGAVQTAVYEMPDLSTPQRNDIMLSKCVEEYTDAAGHKHIVALAPSIVRKMSAPDRRTILEDLAERQPGPRYNEIKFRHEGCGEEVTLALGLTDFFRDLIAGLV